MNKVLEIAPKFPHLAKKILGEKYKGPIKVMVRLHGPLGQIKWTGKMTSWMKMRKMP